jgi:hypothetical protein
LQLAGGVEAAYAMKDDAPSLCSQEGQLAIKQTATITDDAPSMYAAWKRALPSRISHRISHPIPSYAVGRNGMNGWQISHETSEFPNRAIQKRTG